MKTLKKIYNYLKNFHRDYAQEAQDAKDKSVQAQQETIRLKKKYGLL